jgi:hypothetical protein
VKNFSQRRPSDMAYDPVKPRETSKPPAKSSSKSNKSLASMFGFTAASAPTEKDPYGKGLGYDPVNPRETARGASWANEFISKQPYYLGRDQNNQQLVNPNAGNAYLSPKGHEAILAANPDWKPESYRMTSGGGFLSF